MANVIDATMMPYRLVKEENDSSSSSSSGESSPVDAVLFVGISLVLGIASRHLLRGTRVPYTVALLVIGIALGSLGSISFIPFDFVDLTLLIVETPVLLSDFFIGFNDFSF